MNKIDRVQLKNRLSPRKPSRKLVVKQTQSNGFYATPQDLRFIFNDLSLPDSGNPKYTLDAALAYGIGVMSDMIQERRLADLPVEPIAMTLLFAQEGDTFFYTVTIADLGDKENDQDLQPEPEQNPADREA